MAAGVVADGAAEEANVAAKEAAVVAEGKSR